MPYWIALFVFMFHSCFSFLPHSNFFFHVFLSHGKNLSKISIIFWMNRWWLSRGHTHEFIVRISTHIRSPFFTFTSPISRLLYQLMKFLVYLVPSFHLVNNKKEPETHRAFSRCWSFLIVLLSLYSIQSQNYSRSFFLWKTEMKLDTCWWWWGLMKWFHSNSSSSKWWNSFFITTLTRSSIMANPPGHYLPPLFVERR